MSRTENSASAGTEKVGHRPASQPRNLPGRSAKARPSARLYVQAAVAEGRSGERLGTEVLRIMHRLEDDLPRLDGYEAEDCAHDARAHNLYGRRGENLKIRYRISKYESHIREHRPLPSSSSNIIKLDDGYDLNVTVDWDGVSKLEQESWYCGMRAGLAARYADRCFPLDRDDLCSEMNIATAKALPKFRGLPTHNAVLAGHGAPKLSTFLWRVMENRLKDLAAAPFCRRHHIVSAEDVIILPDTEIDPAETLVNSLAIRQAMRSTPNSELILWPLAGYRDAELGLGDVRMKRSRAVARLATKLEGWFE